MSAAAHGLDESQEKRAIRALERRFGQSMLPYRIARKAQNGWLITDDENGASLTFGFRGARLVVRSEHPGIS